jgi:hypothetical protein
MKERSHLQAQIVRAWRRCILDDYCTQRINSERSLQASLWSHLNTELPKTRRLFIEPSITIRVPGGLRRVIPDLVICNTQEVISVVELKYQPKKRPSYDKDIGTLAMIARKRRRISIANSRFRGEEKDAKAYALAKNIVFVWAGVHAGSIESDTALFSASRPSLKDKYLELHAITVSDGAPKILRRG